MGVRAPPALLTIKMKKTTWKAVMRYLFMRIHGRIMSMEAPVVPTKLASTAPHARKRVLRSGVDSPRTRMWMPPATMKSAPMRVMKLMYSCATSSMCAPSRRKKT